MLTIGICKIDPLLPPGDDKVKLMHIGRVYYAMHVKALI
jgi:hypothetical protein